MPKSAKSPSRQSPARKAPSLAGQLARLPAEPLPSFIHPQLASLAHAAPTTSGWVHELKLDGYRIQARIQSTPKPHIQLLTRKGLDWTHRMPSLAAVLAKLRVNGALLDGEVVVLDKHGGTSFADLQAAFQQGARHSLTYFVFDLLHCNGRNLRDQPLLDRKQILAALLRPLPANASIRLSEHVAGDGRPVYKKACELGAEGIVSKLAQGRYVSGRSRSWLKLKCRLEQEFVIGGFTLPSNGTHGVGALLLGYYQGGKLIYAGRTGTGFTQKTHRLLRDHLDAIPRKATPFSNLSGRPTRGIHWVNPELVAQVTFSTWTADKLVRQASFKGLREDKPARSVHREA